MGVYIKGMEMPKENDYTIAIVYGDGVVTEYHDDYWIRGADGEKQIGTAVPVPPHGRLIDADALIEDLTLDDGSENSGASLLMSIFLEVLKAAPTIIQAEEGE